MPQEVRLWNISADNHLHEISPTRPASEENLEDWIEHNVSILSDNLLVIGRQVATEFGGFVDLLCLDQDGDLVVVELKRDKTSRGVSAQILDYASWATQLTHDRISELANSYFFSSKKGSRSLSEAFLERFGFDLPDILNESHSMLIVGTNIDPSTERIIRYLSDEHGVRINAATFNTFNNEKDGTIMLARVFAIEPGEVEVAARRRGSTKRQPNATYEELEEEAEEGGVGKLYRLMSDGLMKHLPRNTTRKYLVFKIAIDGGRLAAFNLVPSESSEESGLHFQIYLWRMAQYLGVEPAALEEVLPEDRSDWKYYASASQDMSGYSGYFKESSQVERFLAFLGDRTQEQ